jgi:hypothetical protein
MGVSH